MSPVDPYETYRAIFRAVHPHYIHAPRSVELFAAKVGYPKATRSISDLEYFCSWLSRKPQWGFMLELL